MEGWGFLIKRRDFLGGFRVGGEGLRVRRGWSRVGVFSRGVFIVNRKVLFRI